MIRKLISCIPNTITCLNLISGCLAVMSAFHCDETMSGLKGADWTCIFIGLAAVFDFCDGASARLLHAYSAVGKELDSLADLVSFGVAPAMLMFNLMHPESQHQWLTYTVLLIPAMGALRLAKFNIDDSQTTSFKGLPIPGKCHFLDRHIRLDRPLRLSRHRTLGHPDHPNLPVNGLAHQHVLAQIQEL